MEAANCFWGKVYEDNLNGIGTSSLHLRDNVKCGNCYGRFTFDDQSRPGCFWPEQNVKAYREMQWNKPLTF